MQWATITSTTDTHQKLYFLLSALDPVILDVRPSANISGDLYDGNADRLTDIGQQLNESWHAAYAADPAEFSALQDTFAYDNYYVPAETYLASRGIDISNRADSVKGLCWGLANLFGTSGWHKFVGGWSDGYVNGTYYNSYNYPGAGLTNDMTDEQFVTTLCDYVIAHVAEFYHGQPQYHKGWTNRYKQEKELCLSLLPEKPTVPPVEEEPPAADSPAVPPVGNTPPEEGSGDAPSGETKPPESVLPPEVNPPAAPEGNPPSAPNEPAPPANDGAGQADPDETPKLTKTARLQLRLHRRRTPKTRRLPLDPKRRRPRKQSLRRARRRPKARKRRRDQVCKSRRKKWRTAASPPLKSQPPLRRSLSTCPRPTETRRTATKQPQKPRSSARRATAPRTRRSAWRLEQPASPRSQALRHTRRILK